MEQTQKLAPFFVAIILCCSLFSASPVTQPIAQPMLVGLVTLLAILSLFWQRRKVALTSVEVVLIVSGFYSCIVSTIIWNEFSLTYSIIFLWVLVAIILSTRSFNLAVLMKAASYTLIFAIVYIVLLQRDEYLIGIGANIDQQFGLIRFTAFGMHPNLSGLVFGFFAIIAIFEILSSFRRSRKVLWAGCLLFCISVILAASARATAVALVFAISLSFGPLIIRNLVGRFWVTSGLGFGFLIVMMMIWEPLLFYIVDIFEFESNTRGLESGGTGRVGLWAEGLETIMNDTTRFLFGGGYRSAGEEFIGFHLESSYLNLWFELGIIFSIAIVSLFSLNCYRGYISFYGYKVSSFFILQAVCLLLFILIQSIFNRYLIGIGNFASLMTIFIISLLSGAVSRSEINSLAE